MWLALVCSAGLFAQAPVSEPILPTEIEEGNESARVDARPSAPADPVDALLDRIIAQGEALRLDRPLPKEFSRGGDGFGELLEDGDAARDLAEPDDVVNGLIDSGLDRRAEARLEARKLVERAKMLAEVGELAGARRLAVDAAKLDPNNEDIRTFLRSVSGDAAAAELSDGEADGVATASRRLTVALATAKKLAEAGRTDEARDLAGGVIEGALLLPADSYPKVLVDSARQLASRTAVAPAPLAVAPAEAMPAPLWYTNVKARLAAPFSYDCRNQPVALILDDISRHLDVKIYLDRPVSRSRIAMVARLDVRVEDEPMEHLLHLACKAIGNEYVIMEKAIVVCSPPQARDYRAYMPGILFDQWSAANSIFPALPPSWLANLLPSTKDAPALPTGLFDATTVPLTRAGLLARVRQDLASGGP